MVNDKKVTIKDLKFYDTVMEADKYMFMALSMDKDYLGTSKLQKHILNVKDRVQYLRSEIFYQLYNYTLEHNKKLEHYFDKLPQQVYIVHNAGSSNPHKAADFFVIGNLPFKEQGYDMQVCEHVQEFRLKFPVYRYAFSDDNAHNDKYNKWEVNFTGWTDVTDWLKEEL